MKKKSEILVLKKRCSFKKNSYPQDFNRPEPLHAPRFYHKFQPYWGQNYFLFPEFTPDAKKRSNFMNFCAAILDAISRGGVLLGRENPLLRKLLDRVNPLLCMCGGAVNRQPGYRARNLHRRGEKRNKLQWTRTTRTTITTTATTTTTTKCLSQQPLKIHIFLN